MSRLVVTLATLAAALGLAVPAAHAATWSAPTTLSAPHTFVGPLAVGGGGTVVAWPWQDGVGQNAPGGAAFAGRPPTGVFGPERPAPTGLLDVAAYGSTRTLALAMTIAPGSGPTGAQNQRLAYAYGRRDGGFEATRTLHTGPIVYRPQLAVNGVGRALIAWVEVTRTSSGGTRRIVRAAERTGSRGFGAPVTLSGQGRADAIAVAVGDRGDEALVVVRQGRLLARVKRTGHGWGAVLDPPLAPARPAAAESH